MKKALIYLIFPALIGLLVLIAEVQVRFTGYGKEGDAIVVFFYCGIVAGIFCVIFGIPKGKIEDDDDYRR